MKADWTWIVFFLMLGLVLFGVTQCVREGVKQTWVEQSDYKQCLKGCGKEFWTNQYVDTSCIILCGFSVGNLNRTMLQDMVNETLRLREVKE